MRIEDSHHLPPVDPWPAASLPELVTESPIAPEPPTLAAPRRFLWLQVIGIVAAIMILMATTLLLINRAPASGAAAPTAPGPTAPAVDPSDSAPAAPTSAAADAAPRPSPSATTASAATPTGAATTAPDRRPAAGGPTSPPPTGGGSTPTPEPTGTYVIGMSKELATGMSIDLETGQTASIGSNPRLDFGIVGGDLRGNGGTRFALWSGENTPQSAADCAPAASGTTTWRYTESVVLCLITGDGRYGNVVIYGSYRETGTQGNVTKLEIYFNYKLFKKAGDG